MVKAPFNLVLKYESIDTANYPANAQDKQSKAFQKHLQSNIEQQYRTLGGNLDIDFRSDEVAISWSSDNSISVKKEQALQLLQSGEFEQATLILESILKQQPDDTDTLYNLGMVYSDQDQLPEAIDLLTKATQQDSTHNHAFIALGVAQLRNHEVDLAEKSLKSALLIDSDDPYALRTLATLHMHKQDYITAISVLRHSLELLPNDHVSLLNLAICLFKTRQAKNIDEAGVISSRLIEERLAPEILEKAWDLQRDISYHKFRKSSGKHENSDAVFHCIDALRRLKDTPKKEIAAVALEVAQLGQNGLNINDPEITYSIKSMSGKFTGLALVCLLHVALQKISPESDSGFDIQKEYEIAKSLFEK